ncbi:MAG: hypothetical protein GF334_03075, partial [Candidatus Altiarchaeales archaeon]|nr:hypothetical protein [Candidatus Altiarchaeales archaeon]
MNNFGLLSPSKKLFTIFVSSLFLFVLFSAAQVTTTLAGITCDDYSGDTSSCGGYIYLCEYDNCHFLDDYCSSDDSNVLIEQDCSGPPYYLEISCGAGQVCEECTTDSGARCVEDVDPCGGN